MNTDVYQTPLAETEMLHVGTVLQCFDRGENYLWQYHLFQVRSYFIYIGSIFQQEVVYISSEA